VENDSPAWVDAVAAIARRRSEPGATILGLFEDAAPDLSDRRTFEKFVADRLKDDPELLDAWQAYSWDKRTSPSPYLDGLEVGLYDRGRRDATEHRDTPLACADFVFREASWVLLQQRTGPA
jgi:hypothetical protein